MISPASPKRLLVLGCVVVLLGSSGCSTGAADEQSVMMDRIKGLALREAKAGHTTQAEALRDGVASAAEYRESITASTECMRRAGVQVSALRHVQTIRGERITYEWEPGAGMSPDETVGVVDGCDRRYHSGVAEAFTMQAIEIVPVARPLLRQCVIDAGLDEPPKTARRWEEFFGAPTDDPAKLGIIARCHEGTEAVLNGTASSIAPSQPSGGS